MEKAGIASPFSAVRGTPLGLVVLSQLVVLVLLVTEAPGLPLPLIRPVVAFLYLALVPGLLVIRVLRLRDLGLAETLCYTVGLSVTFEMLLGLLINTIGPLLGTAAPLSANSIIITTTVVVAALTPVAWWRNRDYLREPRTGNTVPFPVFPLVLLALILLLSVVGSHLAYYYHNSAVLLIMVALIAVLVGLVAFHRIPEYVYPLAVFVVALALVYHRGLVSPYLVGMDVSAEFYFSNLTLQNGLWASALPNAYNSMLSITLLPVMYSHFMGTELQYIFKFVLPIINAVGPVALYLAFRRKIGTHAAFLAVFFFMSIPLFTAKGIANLREAVAEVFAALIILLLLGSGTRSVQTRVLTIAFSFSLVTSHYSTGLALVIVLGIAFVMMVIYGRTYRGTGNPNHTAIGSTVMLLTVMAVTWYTYVGGAAIFRSTVNIGEWIFSGITRMTDISARGDLVMRFLGVVSPTAWTSEVNRYLFWATSLFIVVGAGQVFLEMLRHHEAKVTPELATMAFGSLTLLGLAVLLPFVSGIIGMDRLYHKTLLFLAPFSVLGGVAVFRAIVRLLAVSPGNWLRWRDITGLPILASVILIPHFLLNVGFVAEIAGGPPVSIPLSMERMKQSADLSTRIGFVVESTYKQEYYAAGWLGHNKSTGVGLYGDIETIWSDVPAYSMVYPKSWVTIPLPAEGDAYVFLSYLNVVDGVFVMPAEESVPGKRHPALNPAATSDIAPYLGSRIYANGGSEVWLHTSE